MLYVQWQGEAKRSKGDVTLGDSLLVCSYAALGDSLSTAMARSGNAPHISAMAKPCKAY